MKDYRVTLTVQITTSVFSNSASNALVMVRNRFAAIDLTDKFESSEESAYIDWDNKDGSVSYCSLDDGDPAELLEDEEGLYSLD